jgi:hypothetical protein
LVSIQAFDGASSQPILPIRTHSSGKVMAKSAHSAQLPFTNGRPLECDYFQPFQGFLLPEEISSFLTAQGSQFDRLYRRRFGRTAITHMDQGPIWSLADSLIEILFLDQIIDW